MIEIECPFCDEPMAVELGAFMAERFVIRCEGCSVETEVTDMRASASLALAA